MRIGNVGLFVKDLEAAKKFFEENFEATVLAEYNEPEKGYYSYIMGFATGCKLELMTKPEIVDQPKDKNRTGFAHLSMKVDTAEQLFALIDRWKAAGYEILYEPATVGGKEVRAVAFEDNVFEVSY